MKVYTDDICQRLSKLYREHKRPGLTNILDLDMIAQCYNSLYFWDYTVELSQIRLRIREVIRNKETFINDSDGSSYDKWENTARTIWKLVF